MPSDKDERAVPLNCDRDPARWAREFNEIHCSHGNMPLDEGWLIGWFANAMMCGEDTYRWREEAKARDAVPECGTINAAPQGSTSDRLQLDTGTSDIRERSTPTSPAVAAPTPRTDAHYGRLPNGRQVRGTVQDYEYSSKLERDLYFWKNEAGRFEESNRQAQETIADLRDELAEQKRASDLIIEGLLKTPVSTSGRWVPEDEYEALRQLQFYARHPGQENMVVHFLREIEECDKRNAVSARPLNNDTSTTAAKS